jgi:hypothetical protein
MKLLVLAKNAMNKGFDAIFVLAAGAQRKLALLVKLTNQYCSRYTSPRAGMRQRGGRK